MHNLSALSALQERLRTGPDRELDASIYVALERGEDPANYRLNRQYADSMPKFTGSVDAALALVEKVLPGSYGHVDFGKPTNDATIYYDHGEGTATGYGATPALALLSALLFARVAKPSSIAAPAPRHTTPAELARELG